MTQHTQPYFLISDVMRADESRVELFKVANHLLNLRKLTTQQLVRHIRDAKVKVPLSALHAIRREVYFQKNHTRREINWITSRKTAQSLVQCLRVHRPDVRGSAWDILADLLTKLDACGCNPNRVACWLKTRPEITFPVHAGSLYSIKKGERTSFYNGRNRRLIEYDKTYLINKTIRAHWDELLGQALPEAV